MKYEEYRTKVQVDKKSIGMYVFLSFFFLNFTMKTQKIVCTHLKHLSLPVSTTIYILKEK